jgi:hypothetical protein
MLAFHVGCSSEPAERSSSVSLTPAVHTIDAAEHARIRAFLDEEYAATDVRHSFRTKLGQTVDCVDFFATPGVKALAAQGHPLTEPPVDPPWPVSVPRTKAEVEFDGEADDEGNARRCPAGSVATIRVTEENIAARGGLDAVLQAGRNALPLHGPLASARAPSTSPPAVHPPQAGYCTNSLGGADAPGYAHVQQTWNPGNNGSLPQQAGPIQQGVAAFSLNPFAPVPPDGSHDVAQTWMFAGEGFKIDGCMCTTDPSQASASNPLCSQTVEIGWMISPLATPNTTIEEAPFLFAYATNDGYETGCIQGTDNGGVCLTFVPSTNRTLAPGVALGSQGTLPVITELVTSGGVLGWWVAAGGSWLGYYPARDFTGPMSSSGAQTFQAGGEVYDFTGTWEVPMGSGASPVTGNEGGNVNAAYADNVNPGCVSGSCGSSTMVVTVPSNYNYSTAPAAPASSTSISNYFYFGNVPGVFWGNDYGDSWSPTNPKDWASGSYKGQCGDGVPVTGLSEYPSGQRQAHAVKCGGNYSFTPNNASCVVEAFNSDDIANPSWDWDVGDLKAECPATYYVQGVAQNSAGLLDAILCCPSGQNWSVSPSNCSTQVLYQQNSPGFSGYADWDYGYNKADCPMTTRNGVITPTTQLVAGVSAHLGSSPVGGPHAILCCTQ